MSEHEDPAMSAFEDAQERDVAESAGVVVGTFPQIQIGDDLPDGQFEILVGQEVATAVYHHPRIPDHWIAWRRPIDWRDSGLKRFKTQRGARAWAHKNALAATLTSPRDAETHHG